MDKERKKELGAPYHEQISRRVEKLRAARGWSLRDMAPQLGMTYGNLSHKLRGYTHWSIDDIAAIEHVTREKLIEVVYDTRCPLNAAALEGTGDSINRISIKGARFHMISGGEEVATINNDLEVVVLRVNDGITKTYYKDAWNPNQEAESPTCQSDDGVTPRADATAPQARTCAECPHNIWGSKINPRTGAQGRACADTKRMSIVPSDNIAAEPYQLAVPAASLKDWGSHIRKLCAVQPPVPYNAIVTRVAFDTTATFPKLLFSPVRFLSADEYQQAEGRYDEEPIKLTAGLAEAAAAYAQQRADAGQAMGIPGSNPVAQARAAVDNVLQQPQAQPAP